MSTMKRRDLGNKIKQAFKWGSSPASNVGSSRQSKPASSVQLTPTASNPTTSTPSLAPVVEPGPRIYNAAISVLEPDDQDTIRRLVVNQDLDSIQGVQDIILTQRKKCATEGWTMTVKGHTIQLTTIASSLSQLLDKIQPGLDLASQVTAAVRPGIDLAASIDPLHLGVPIALIRAVLGVVVFSSEQMQRLLSGMTTATYMLTQLGLYFEYLKHVSSPKHVANLEEGLTKSYSLVLEFLAVGYRALTKHGLKRAWELLWSKDTVRAFECKCAEVRKQLEAAANLCSRDSSQSEAVKMTNKIDRIIDETKKLPDVKTIIRALEVKIDLQRLRPANGAAYSVVDSNKDSILYNYCLSGTRQNLIAQIVAWCHQSHQTVFWLRGMAGTGKSTLIRTVARQLEDEGLLVVSFFFRQDVADQRDGTSFVPTILAQLLTKYPLLRPSVAVVLDTDLTLLGGAIANQFTKLIKDPIIKAGLPKLILVVDALDECATTHATVILQQLAQLAQHIDIRIVITSRPESQVRKAFSEFKPDSIRLEEVQEEEIRADLRLFLDKCFESLVEKDSGRQHPQLTIGWPGGEQVEQLVQLTMPLFIYAATVVRYVSESRSKARLASILEANHSTNLTGVQRVYLPVLEHVYHNAEQQDVVNFQKLVGSIVLLQNPLSTQALSVLLDLSLGDIEDVLNRLHSVLNISPTLPVRVLHKSFKDFLLDPGHRFQINIAATNRALQERCLALMEDRLRRDVCGLSVPGIRRRDITNVGHYINSELEYACLYWVSHTIGPVQDGDGVHQFLERHLLHWLEALGWLGRVSEASRYVQQLRSHVEVDSSPRLSALLDDALRFTWLNWYIIDLAPLQLYHSVLLFTPSQSLTRQVFHGEALYQFSLLPKTFSGWSAERQKLEGHHGWVTAVAFSPDGKLLASASYDKTVRVWDAATGEQRQKLVEHDDWVDAIAFSPDGKLLASASRDTTVRVWDAATGEQRQKLAGHDDWVNAVVAFSLDSISLRTNIGEFLLSPTSVSRKQETPPATALELRDEWIYYQGQAILWLPHEYRGQYSAVYEGTLAIGHASGAVSFFRI